MSESPNTSRLGLALNKMTDRERRLVFLTGGVAVTLLIVGIASGINGAVTSREKKIAAEKDQIAQMEALRVEYDAAVARQKAAEARIKSAPTTSLMTYVDNSLRELSLPKDDLQQGNPTPVKDSDFLEYSATFTIKELSIDKLTALLEKIEGRNTGGVVKVTKLKVKTRFDKPDMLEAALTVSTWKPKEGSAAAAATVPGVPK